MEAGWVSLLRQRLQQTGLADPQQVVNASISGETTSGGLTRLPELLQRHEPQLVVIELGANDGLRGTPLVAVERNLNALISTSKQAGAEVMVLGMRIPPNYGHRYTEAFYQLFARVAEDHQVAYYPFFSPRGRGASGADAAGWIAPQQPGPADTAGQCLALV